MSQSTQEKLDRVRPPKVQIKYDVESYGTVEKREIPFVMGVLADLSGDNMVLNKDGFAMKVKDRPFVNIDGDEFNTVLKASRPRVKTVVADKISGGDRSMAIDMEFESLDDFSPETIAQKVGPIRKLVDARRRLASLKQKMDGNDELEQLVNDILVNAELRSSIKAQVSQVSTPEMGEE